MTKIVNLEASPFGEGERARVENLITGVMNAVTFGPRERFDLFVHTERVLTGAEVYTYRTDSEERTIILRSCFVDHSYSLAELRGALETGTPLTRGKAAAARHAIAHAHDELTRDRVIDFGLYSLPAERLSADVARYVTGGLCEQFPPVWGRIDDNNRRSYGITCTLHARVGGLAVFDSERFAAWYRSLRRRDS